MYLFCTQHSGILYPFVNAHALHFTHSAVAGGGRKINFVDDSIRLATFTILKQAFFNDSVSFRATHRSIDPISDVTCISAGQCHLSVPSKTVTNHQCKKKKNEGCGLVRFGYENDLVRVVDHVFLTHL